MTGGFGVDYTIEVGGKDTLAKTTMAIRVAGQVNVIGLLSGMPEVGQEVLLRTLSIHGSSIGSREHFEQMNRAVPSAPGAASGRVWHLMSRGRGPRTGHRRGRAFMVPIL